MSTTSSTRCSGVVALAANALLPLILLLSASQLTAVDAHGYVTTPLTEFTNGVMFTKYSATMSPAFAGKFDDSPQANVDTFTKAFDAQKAAPDGFSDLRALVKDHGGECGESNAHASPKPIPSDGVVVWQNPDTGEGFVPSHTGPCEIWLDDTRVFHDDNCAGHYPSKPKAELKVDFSACKGSCTLRFYWLALHEPTWQIYKNCIPLAGNGGGTSGNGATKIATTTDDGNAKVTVANEYSAASSETPTMAPSPSPTTSEYASPSPTPSRRKCSKIKSSAHKRQ